MNVTTWKQLAKYRFYKFLLLLYILKKASDGYGKPLFCSGNYMINKKTFIISIHRWNPYEKQFEKQTFDLEPNWIIKKTFTKQNNNQLDQIYSFPPLQAHLERRRWRKSTYLCTLFIYRTNTSINSQLSH